MCAKILHGPGNRRRAAVMVQAVVFGSLVGVGVMALAIDTGYMFASRAEMQRVADAAALAGASGLDLGNSVAHQRATSIAATNAVDDLTVSAGELITTLGNWDGIQRRFTAVTGAEPVSPNAMRAAGKRRGMSLFFGRLIGIDTTSVSRGATAISSGGVCAGVWGIQGVTGDGNISTDSYDAQAGPYGPGNMNPHGDVCSCRDIVLNGSVDIYGDTIFGHGYSLSTFGSSYRIYGLVGEQDCGSTLPTYNIPDHTSMNNNAQIGLTDRGHDPFGGSHWDFVVTGNDNLTINGGDYYFTSASVDGRATVTITGPTTFYIDGPAVFTGDGLVNTSQDPADLVIYSVGSTLTLTGTGGFYGAVIAPSADIILEGTGEYFGTILGRTLDADGTADIHVEESLVFSLFGIRSVAPILVE